ncbi:hypothetical protein KPH14_005893 [Odynerus spinipes]|uniref:Adenylate kinase 7 n=1 Tax=Odynerus spinipes TaxID=1348599 RepID=A0AAD9VKG8_9HYME|nr:hypothetical protein KPH14_005893 [Odynerus spinipes]
MFADETESNEKNISLRLSKETADVNEGQEETDFFPWRIFINHVDSYHGRKLASALSELPYVNPQIGRGAAAAAENEEEGAEEKEEDEADEGEAATDEPRSEGGEQEPLRKYEVIGTLLEYKYPYPEEVTRVVKDTASRKELLSELMKCGIVIYDITWDRSQVEEASWVLEAIQEKLEVSGDTVTNKKKKEKVEIPRYFILISTIMTWALTKPLDPEDPDLPLTEVDYRKRRAHPNFKEHLRCERNVVIVKKRADLKRKLKTLVICCGITYGEEEEEIHYLFKMAWLNEPFLPIIGNGENRIPLLHVRDFVAVVSDVLRKWPTLRYIVAVEQGAPTQSTIVKNISKQLTTGRVKYVAPEDAFLYPEISQEIYDFMTVDLNIDPAYVLERIRWHFETPFADNIGQIIKEYRASRELRPIRIIVLGPPASGKTRVARYLADHYRLHYINVQGLINDTIQKLTAEIEARTDEKDVTGEGEGQEGEHLEEDDEEDISVDELREQLNEIRQNLAKNDGRLDDAALNKLSVIYRLACFISAAFPLRLIEFHARVSVKMRNTLFLKRLWSKDCLNQGYIIDAYPKTYEQARILFENAEEKDETLAEEEEEEEGEEEDEDKRTLEEIDIKASIMPELVVALEASDDFLKERIIDLSEREVQGTHYTEKEMIRRLREYRERNTDDNTPLQFFDEMEVHPLIIPIEDDICPDMFPTIYQCLKKLGAPRNYGLTPAEAREAQERADARKKAAEEAARARAERELEKCKKEREQKMMEWMDLLEKLQEEEEERLCVMGQPLRHYLVRYVFPTLTKGLIEVAKLRPDDPVDFLAEYLFRENPEGKMFQPDYTETMSMILDAIATLEDTIFPKEEELHDVTEKILKSAADGTILPTPSASLTGIKDDSDDLCASMKSSSSIKEPSYTFGEGESDYAGGRNDDFELSPSSEDSKELNVDN